ncbi:hypothetical protein BCV72DRAFT_335194 [Rhizopus microsporus var. microsporus]|uniref:Uncharacterized protein n=1 Tax=Rhizopus microsporus var. microsporus TaxID=86635 RepID=A0A1X0R6B3_RHIZD|nr:hypothetical protein BCV72DRAFT_335194 [Rhizopus microsporus var. microsporus]
MSFMMDRATEAAASDLAEVRKLIESMNALVSSQQQQQQQQQQLLQKQKELQLQQQQQQQQQPQQPPQQSQPPQEQQQQQEEERNLTKEESKEAPLVHNQQLHQQSLHHHHQQQQPQETQLNPSLMPQGTTQNWPANTNTQYAAPNFSHQNHVNTTTTTTHDAKTQNTSVPPMAQALPTAGVIVEVSHITYSRTYYFQLSPEATIEPLIAWLRLTFQDPTISGMVLQYKGFDGLWKCLLNRDDSLKRVLKQNLKNNTILQMRVPCEQDLLSSGYTDKRLLALTTKPIAPSIEQANATSQMMEDNNANNNSHNSNSDNNNSNDSL